MNLFRLFLPTRRWYTRERATVHTDSVPSVIFRYKIVVFYFYFINHEMYIKSLCLLFSK